MSEMHILIVRADHLGDTLLSTPLLAALHNFYPKAKITVLVSPLGAQALVKNPHVHNIITIDPQISLLDKLYIIKKLRRCKFNITFCLSEKLLPRLITWVTNSKIRIGFFPGCTQPLVSLICLLGLTHRINSRQLPADPNPPHEVERYALLLNALDIAAQPQRLEVYLSETELEWAQNWLSSHLSDNEVPVVINMNKKWIEDGWRIQDVNLIFTSLTNTNPNVFFIITTDNIDAHIADSIILTNGNDRFCIISGESFGYWAALIKLSRALITMDTGASHLGAAVGTAIVDIFPATSFEHCSKRWSPWKVQHRIIRRNQLDIKNSLLQTDQFSKAITNALTNLLE